MPDEIMQKLNSGREMRTGTDWYDFIRGKEITQKLNESLEKSMARLNFNKYETVEEFDARLDEQ